STLSFTRVGLTFSTALFTTGHSRVFRGWGPSVARAPRMAGAPGNSVHGIGRGSRIRTGGLPLPKRTRYQPAQYRVLRPAAPSIGPRRERAVQYSLAAGARRSVARGC